ncbi:hypothetical protein ACFL9T_05805 [Thermodesulfobacteriota bacterium]
MRSYLIDELSGPDLSSMKGFLKRNSVKSALDDLFWVECPTELLGATQIGHLECGPHVFAVEVGADSVKLELFIRSLKRMNCTCQAFCTPQQRDFILKYAHRMIQELDIHA